MNFEIGFAGYIAGRADWARQVIEQNPPAVARYFRHGVREILRRFAISGRRRCPDIPWQISSR